MLLGPPIAGYGPSIPIPIPPEPKYSSGEIERARLPAPPASDVDIRDGGIDFRGTRLDDGRFVVVGDVEADGEDRGGVGGVAAGGDGEIETIGMGRECCAEVDGSGPVDSVSLAGSGGD